MAVILIYLCCYNGKTPKYCKSVINHNTRHSGQVHLYYTDQALSLSGASLKQNKTKQNNVHIPTITIKNHLAGQFSPLGPTFLQKSLTYKMTCQTKIIAYFRLNFSSIMFN